MAKILFCHPMFLSKSPDEQASSSPYLAATPTLGVDVILRDASGQAAASVPSRQPTAAPIPAEAKPTAEANLEPIPDPQTDRRWLAPAPCSVRRWRDSRGRGDRCSPGPSLRVANRRRGGGPEGPRSCMLAACPNSGFRVGDTRRLPPKPVPRNGARGAAQGPSGYENSVVRISSV